MYSGRVKTTSKVSHFKETNKSLDLSHTLDDVAKDALANEYPSSFHRFCDQVSKKSLFRLTRFLNDQYKNLHFRPLFTGLPICALSRVSSGSSCGS